LKLLWILRHAFAIAVLPVTVTILVPRWLCRRYSVTLRAPADSSEWLCVILGVLLCLAGLALFVTTLFLFAKRGRGTLAPWDPPVHLVIAGPYRFVRNPMVSGVLLITAGESLILRSSVHAIWAGVFLLLNAIYIPLIEEPQLHQRFGEAYREYTRNVPRFLPRLSPWK
jgi:protein-S-isoprenylcysteine O-methyltransferase Ste14